MCLYVWLHVDAAYVCIHVCMFALWIRRCAFTCACICISINAMHSCAHTCIILWIYVFFSMVLLLAPPPGRNVTSWWFAPRSGMVSLWCSALSMEPLLRHFSRNLRWFNLVVLDLGAPLLAPFKRRYTNSRKECMYNNHALACTVAYIRVYN